MHAFRCSIVLFVQACGSIGLVPILMDLTLCGFDELVTASFELLGRQYCQRKNFIRSVQRLQLLVDEVSVGAPQPLGCVRFPRTVPTCVVNVQCVCFVVFAGICAHIQAVTGHGDAAARAH